MADAEDAQHWKVYAGTSYFRPHNMDDAAKARMLADMQRQIEQLQANIASIQSGSPPMSLRIYHK